MKTTVIDSQKSAASIKPSQALSVAALKYVAERNINNGEKAASAHCQGGGSWQLF